jgi:hypothetical protein
MSISPKDRERLNHIWMALEAIEVHSTGFMFSMQPVRFHFIPRI